MSTPSWPGPKSCRITPNLFPLVPLPSLHGCGRWEFKHKKQCHVKHVSWKDFVDEEPGRMCWEKPALCFLTLCLIFGQWGLPWWNLWGHAETFSSWNVRRRCHLFLDALWEKAPLTAISLMETQIMFALNIWGSGATLVWHYVLKMFYNRAKNLTEIPLRPRM